MDARPDIPAAANDGFDVWKEDRLTEERPKSARFVPDEDRWNSGWFGRDIARDCLPDMLLPWPLEYCALDIGFDLFIAEDGCGMLVLRFMPPSV